MSSRSQSPRWAVLRNNGLLFACLALFGVFFLGMSFSGAATYNEEQQQHGSTEHISVAQYFTTGDFVEATFENWESEFLQMGMYVVLTAFLFQKGSSESKPIDEPAPQDQDPRDAKGDSSAPWPVRRAGLALMLYENSLAIAFFVLFFASMALHAVGGRTAFNEERSTKNRSSMGRPQSRCGSTSPRRNSGSNRCRIGRASSWPWPPSSGYPSSCASAARRSPNGSPNRTGTPAHEPSPRPSRKPVSPPVRPGLSEGASTLIGSGGEVSVRRESVMCRLRFSRHGDRS